MPVRKPALAMCCVAILCAGGHVGTLARGADMEQKSTVIGFPEDTLHLAKRLILAFGPNCLYSSMYNNTPCAQFAAFDVYLVPDPGPDGQRQWNVSGDRTLGDFRTIVIRDRAGNAGHVSVDFTTQGAPRLSFGSGISEARAKALVDAAVAAVIGKYAHGRQ